MPYKVCSMLFREPLLDEPGERRGTRKGRIEKADKAFNIGSFSGAVVK